MQEHLAQLSRLRAEEALMLATAVAVGSGSLKPARARQIQAAWMREIGHEGGRALRQAPVGMGIKIVGGPDGDH